LSLNPDQAISYILQLIKGERSFWVNKNHLCSAPFQWQDEHFALAVSESNLGAVRNYIRNQEQHHQQKSFEQECRELLSKNGFTAKQLHHGVVVSEISR
jgi:hypothetical protein